MTAIKDFKKSPYVIGVDLGTTNSTVAYIDTSEGKRENLKIRIFKIPQITKEGLLSRLDILPSYLYLPGEYEIPAEMMLPWQKDINYLVGEFAGFQGAKVPTHLVSSAKSWLCHNRVDRRASILPWGLKETSLRRVSPVYASSCYLKHMKAAWNYEIAKGREDYRFERQQIIITIPASFDESARELTSEAAKSAGIERFTMLEEPQAAFYSWLAFHHKQWSELIIKDKVVLVIDIGGGTTDFNLITLKSEHSDLYFERVAVGEHLMLGGDNMDLTLAREMEKKILGEGKNLDLQRWLSLAYQCRTAKEELLGDIQKKSYTITILGSGRQVVGGSLQEALTREDVERVILNGFFNDVGITEEIEKNKPLGFHELGLPFVSEPSVLKHLSTFLNLHGTNPLLGKAVQTREEKNFICPDMILFNGGVFKSPLLRERVAAIVKNWFTRADWDLTILQNDKLDHAVSMGAAYYGMVLRGKGLRISGGTGRAYYIAVEDAIPKNKEVLSLACLVPRGLEEGEEIHLKKPEFQVMTNQPVSFPLYTSSYRVGDKAGDIIKANKDNFRKMPHIKTILHYGKKTGSVKLPVSLGIKLTEFGTLDVWCESKSTPHRWKLAFQVRMERDEEDKHFSDTHTLEGSMIDEACTLIETAFRRSEQRITKVTPDNLIKELTRHFNMDKAELPISSVRKMWDTLIKYHEQRRITPMHEARWLNLAGFFLRPGFGHPLDEWRIKALWKTYHKSLAFSRNTQCRLEWWILWRRVAPGLSQGQQEQIFHKIAPWLLSGRKKKGTPNLHSAEINEMWMLAASLEHLSGTVKNELGNEIMKSIQRDKGQALRRNFWILSRLGARIPFHGPVNNVVPLSTVETWIEKIINIPWLLPKEASYTLAQMARKTGDRTRDIEEKMRNRIIAKLSEYEWSGQLVRLLKEIVPIEEKEKKSIFGESLPVGLYVESTNF